RWTVERTFGWFNFFRRLAKDFEKTVESSATWILLANSKIILNRIQPWQNFCSKHALKSKKI
ncbi:MAG: transposase, partial [Bacteroidota bacterium]